MKSWLLVLALAWPVAALAHSRRHAKKDEVTIWPPPAPGTNQAGEPLPPPKPKSKSEKQTPDAGDIYEMDPDLTQSPDPGSTAPAPVQTEAQRDVCADAAASCSETCIVVHSNDDTLHAPPGKPLPIQVCEGRCHHRYRICKEQQRIGIDQNDPHRREDELRDE